jgi:hypothetical protein
MTSDNRLAELLALAEAFCHDELTAEQRARLEQLVTADQELRRAYVRYLHMHVCLRRAFEKSDEADDKVTTRQADQVTIKAPVTLSSGRRVTLPGLRLLGGRRSVGLAAASVLALAGVALALLWHKHGRDLPTVASHVAVLTQAGGCVWEAANLQAGDKLEAGRLELVAGLAEITFNNGAVALIEAPAVVDLVSSSRGFLHAGRVFVTVPPQAIGFVMDTSRARLRDLGTKFGVAVVDRGETLIDVVEGVVEYDLKSASAKGTQRLTAGQGVRIEEDTEPQPMEPDPTRFIRRMPPAKERGSDWLVPYNNSRYDSINIVPASAGIKIDGDLSDWDRSGRFFIACAEPFIRDYNVEGAMMYDANYLYVGAHVMDPAAMSSSINPKTEPGLGWKGGGVQVRICTDRTKKWPLDAVAFPPKHSKLRPDDKSDQLVHLTMWYYQRDALPCLHLHYGMDFHGQKVNPPGFKAAYRKDPDGRGYTMEYAIPWTLLCDGKEPPRGGDELAACWNIHWSDEEGRLWRGYLVDILNPDEKGFTYQRARTWGRAVFHKAGELAPGTVVPRY